MIVDDEPDITSALKIALEDDGFVVDSFNDPILALENFRKGSYGLLILDIKIPKMNGFELYTKIKLIHKKCISIIKDYHVWQMFMSFLDR